MYFLRGLMVVIAIVIATIVMTIIGVPLVFVFMAVEVPLAFITVISIVGGLIILGWAFTVFNIRRRR